MTSIQLIEIVKVVHWLMITNTVNNKSQEYIALF